MLQQVYAVCSVNEKNGFLVVKQGERSMQIGSLGKKISKRLLVFVMILLSLTILVVPVNVYAAGQEVAEVDGKRHTTLTSAIDAASEGSTVVLLSDVTEDVTFDKNITIDGGSKYTIFGVSTVKAGTLTNLTLKPSENKADGKFLTLVSGTETSIKLENVTVHYSVQNRSSGSAVTVSGNKADIIVNNCRFINTPNNGGVTVDAPEWSYGLFVNEQNSAGSITFTNNEFNGAFRTMLANVSGNFLIEDCKFINSVYSVVNGPTSGSGSEATTITTSSASNNNIVVKTSVFDNAGAIYLQSQANFAGNTFQNDKFEHYIQVKGSIGQPIDFTNNTFQQGDNDLVIIDVAATSVLLPVGQTAVNYWVWADTPEDVRPDDYSDYKYMYNEDGNITFMPQSDVALEQFFSQKGNGNIQVDNNDTVLIEKNLKLKNLNVDADNNITFEITKDSTLEIEESLDIKGKVAVKGEGMLAIAETGKVIIDTNAALDVAPNMNFENNGTILNNGELIIPDSSTGNGTIDGEGTTEKVHNAKYFEAKEPTCDVDGNMEYWYCEFCDKYYTDKDLTQEISKENTIIKALGHNYVDGKCTVCGMADPHDNQGQVTPSQLDNTEEQDNSSDNPQTGDDSNLVLPIIILSASGIGLVGVSIYLRKRNYSR